MLFEYWERMPSGSNIHPEDEGLMRKCADRFELRIPPGHVNGPLKTAPIVLCLLNPRATLEDTEYLITTEGREMLLRQMGGDENFPSFEPWRKWRNPLVKHVKFGSHPLDSSVAILNICAYSSKGCAAVTDKLKAKLPSIVRAREFFHQVLVPQANRGDRFVVICRAVRAWQMDRSMEGENLRIGPNFRGGFLGPDIGRDVSVWLSRKADRSNFRGVRE
jgi:hypothetical protein